MHSITLVAFIRFFSTVHRGGGREAGGISSSQQYMAAHVLQSLLGHGPPQVVTTLHCKCTKDTTKHCRPQCTLNVTFETVMICYCTKQAPVFLAGVEISADTNFNRINVICDEDEQ